MLDENDLQRYASQLIMPEIEEEGQSILLKSKVLIIGAGGLGNPTAIFCSAAGIGYIDICDHDNIELSNLNRQIAFSINNLGLSKSNKLRDYCLNLNPNLKIQSIVDKFDNKFPVDNYDIILDCSDNIETKYNANISAHKNNKTLISASATQFEGQLAIFKSGKFKNLPCYECIFPRDEHQDTNLNCREVGIIGPVTNLISSLQVTETIRELFIQNSFKKENLFTKNTLAGYLLLYDCIKQEIMKIKIKKNLYCNICK
tara:strand:+ start:342 stop:1115 length:774 start_codon:yes stop_codon:yes gene_type:complete